MLKVCFQSTTAILFFVTISSSFVYHRIRLSTRYVGAMLWSMAQLHHVNTFHQQFGQLSEVGVHGRRCKSEVRVPGRRR